VKEMVKAYVLAKIEAGSDVEVFAHISKLSDIKGASTTYGVYDLIIDVEFESMEKLDTFVFSELRTIPGVKETATVIIAKTLI
jgi:DNA-binding Lrp family transcriptional regulator